MQSPHLFEQPFGVFTQRGGVPDGAPEIRDHFFEQLLAPYQRFVLQIFSIEMKQVENIIKNRRPLCTHLIGLKQLKGRSPSGIERDDFSGEAADLLISRFGV